MSGFIGYVVTGAQRPADLPHRLRAATDAPGHRGSEQAGEFHSPAYLGSLADRHDAELDHIEWNMATFALWRSRLHATPRPSARTAPRAAPVSVG